jgi:hypothetical protein
VLRASRSAAQPARARPTVVLLSNATTVSFHLYGFVQMPIYSKLDGYQLFPHWTAAVGANYAL